MFELHPVGLVGFDSTIFPHIENYTCSYIWSVWKQFIPFLAACFTVSPYHCLSFPMLFCCEGCFLNLEAAGRRWELWSFLLWRGCLRCSVDDVEQCCCCCCCCCGGGGGGGCGGCGGHLTKTRRASVKTSKHHLRGENLKICSVLGWLGTLGSGAPWETVHLRW